MIKLSILIATMPSRKKVFHTLLNTLYSMTPMNGSVEILWDDSMDYNIGVKRNKLLERASGKYISFCDDDDSISTNYILEILKATEHNCDCIGISGIITTNGLKKRQWHISKEYGSWFTKNKVYYRTPNHISPVKREIALQAMFPETSFGEDAEYSKRLLPLLKTETIIKGNLYHYKYSSKK